MLYGLSSTARSPALIARHGQPVATLLMIALASAPASAYAVGPTLRDGSHRPARHVAPLLSTGSGQPIVSSGAGCSLSTTGQDASFGTIGATQPSGAIVETFLNVACHGEVATTLQLCDAHPGPSGMFMLTDGKSAVYFTLDYQTESAGGRILDCGDFAMSLGGDPGQPEKCRLVASIPPTSAPRSPGTYTDTIIARVIY